MQGDRWKDKKFKICVNSLKSKNHVYSCIGVNMIFGFIVILLGILCFGGYSVFGGQFDNLVVDHS